MKKNISINVAIRIAKTHDCSTGFWKTVLDALEFYKTFKDSEVKYG